MMDVDGQMRRSSSASSSPEFEFWIGRNPCFPPPELLTADELFVDGVVLPLQLLSLPRSDSAAQQIPPSPSPIFHPASILSSVSSPSTPTSGSRRWRDLFKVMADKKPEEKENKDERKNERKSSGGGGSAELNINIWPFSRSRSAGNTAGAGSSRTRPIFTLAGRTFSSAPCSRSNSSGESSKPPATGVRRWATSSVRSGVHLGRSSPVRKLRLAGVGRKEMAAESDPVPGDRVLNINLNSCIGHGNQVSCRGEDSDGDVAVGRAVGSQGRLFSLRGLFSKKEY